MGVLNDVDFWVTLLPKQIGFTEVPWYGNALLILWFWCFGANVGSFMNVVVYRLPRGMSITLPRSRCPRCRHKIRWFDNIPVVSWLVLRGRCRDCAAPIAIRYPLVEGLVAAVFVLLAVYIPLNEGENLPNLLPFSYRKLLLPAQFGLYAYLLVLWCTLLCAALISYDGGTPPRKLYMPLFLVSPTAPLIWPGLRPVMLEVGWPGNRWWTAVADGLAGLVVALALIVFIQVAMRHRRRRARNPVLLPLVGCGMVLGWQAVCALAPLATLFELVLAAVSLVWRPAKRIAYSGLLAALLLPYVCCWKTIVLLAPWLGTKAGISTFVGAALAVGALSWLASWLSRRRRRTSARPAANPPSLHPKEGDERQNYRTDEPLPEANEPPAAERQGSVSVALAEQT